MEPQPQPQPPMTEVVPQPDAAEERIKTLGVRLGEELHAQLSFIAQLRGSTITEEIRQSIEARVLSAQDDPELVARAEAVRGEIEREAAARRQAIAGFFGKVVTDAEQTLAETATPKPATPADRPSRRRGGNGSSTAS